jgi:hypothetical protein
MTTAIGDPLYYRLVVKRETNESPCFKPLHLHTGYYSDIRDVMHEIIKYRTKYLDLDVMFLIVSSQRRPIGWVHTSRYIEDKS